MVIRRFWLAWFCLLYASGVWAETVEVSLSDGAPYVQQTVIYSVRVVGRQNLATMGVTLPNMKHVIVKKMDGPKSYLRRKGRVAYTVTEFRYAVTLLTSGALTIPSTTVSVTKKGWRNYYGRRYPANQSFTFTTKPIQLTVKPAAVATGAVWLPLYALRMDAQLLDKAALQVGRPATYKVRIRAVGALAEDLPSLTQMTQQTHFKMYVEQTHLQNVISRDGKTVEGVREEILTLAPQQAGTFELPNAAMDWWDIQQRRQARAEMLSERVLVGGVGDASASRAVRWRMPDFSETMKVVGLILAAVALFVAGIWLGAGQPNVAFVQKRFEKVMIFFHRRIDALLNPLGYRVNRFTSRLDWGQRRGQKFWRPRPALYRLHQVLRRLERALPKTLRARLFFKRLAVVREPRAIAIRLAWFADDFLHLPSNTPLLRIARVLCERDAELDARAVYVLFSALEAALYGHADFNAKRWRKRCDKTFKRTVWRQQGADKAKREHALPALNPRWRG